MDEDDLPVVVSFSSEKLTMIDGGVPTEGDNTVVPTTESFAIPMLPFEKIGWFGKKTFEAGCTWKLVENRNGELCLHWTIDDVFDELLKMPEALMVKTVFGERKKSATGKGFKYEVPISSYQYNPQLSKLVFHASRELLPFYIITAFKENCLQEWDDVIALLNHHHPRQEVRDVREVPEVREVPDVLDEDNVFTADAEEVCIAPRLDIPPTVYQGPIDSCCPF
jgi:hypothetical protein